MLARIVSLVQIAVVVACPMWCSSGLCHAGACHGQSCCPSSSSPNQDSPLLLTESGCDCCKQRSHDAEKLPEPQPCPIKTCQGVCGGAVLEKPIELDDALGSFFCPLNDGGFSCTHSFAECETGIRDHDWLGYCTSHGRRVRILHLSLLC